MALSRSQFEAIAQRALKELPKEFQPYVEECLLIVEDWPSKRLVKEMDLAEDEVLYGLYEGPPLTERHHDDPPQMPPRITLFYRAFVEDFEDEEELIHEIQVTVLHEIGHHFGLDEDRLEELGYA